MVLAQLQGMARPVPVNPHEPFLHTQLTRTVLTHQLEPHDAVHDALYAEPDGLEAALPVTFSCKTSSEHGHQWRDLAKGWLVSR
jgi:hypothetical protein